jgi:hypothetical protein
MCAHIQGFFGSPGDLKHGVAPLRGFFPDIYNPLIFLGRKPLSSCTVCQIVPRACLPPRALTAQGGVRANQDVRGREDWQRRRLLGDEDQDASLDDVCRAVTLGRRGGPAERKKASRVPPISLEPRVATLGVETGSGASGEADEEAAW